MTKNVFGLSGGKDSTCLLGWAIHESGYPRDSLIFTFCDTENEYQEVYIQKHECRPIVRLRASGDWVTKCYGDGYGDGYGFSNGDG